MENPPNNSHSREHTTQMCFNLFILTFPMILISCILLFFWLSLKDVFIKKIKMSMDKGIKQYVSKLSEVDLSYDFLITH